jgi:hypothetical protein
MPAVAYRYTFGVASAFQSGMTYLRIVIPLQLLV